MKWLISVESVIVVILLLNSIAIAEDWSAIAFRDDFNGPERVIDPNIWIVNRPNEWWSLLGRTFFPSPIYHPNEVFPYLDGNGVCVIEHHTYNPRHLGTPKTTFLGGEIHTKRFFAHKHALSH